MDISGYEGLYKIFEDGMILNCKKNTEVRPIYSQGYLIVMLVKNNSSRTHRHHRLIANAFIPNPENKPCVDHINGISIDNSLKNLRWATYAENSRNSNIPINNTSGMKGVQYIKASRKWAAICKGEYLGLFSVAEDAHNAYCKRAKELYGDFYKDTSNDTNFILPELPTKRLDDMFKTIDNTENSLIKVDFA